MTTPLRKLGALAVLGCLLAAPAFAEETAAVPPAGDAPAPNGEIRQMHKKMKQDRATLKADHEKMMKDRATMKADHEKMQAMRKDHREKMKARHDERKEKHEEMRAKHKEMMKEGAKPSMPEDPLETPAPAVQ